MRLVLFFTILVTIFSSFKNKNNEYAKLSLSAVIVSKENRKINVRITLTNNTSDTIKYISWSCSWQKSYSANNEEWVSVPSLCYINGHMTYKIPPHQSEIKYLEFIKVKSNPRIKKSKFKIGFHFESPEEQLKAPSPNNSDTKAEKAIIWSNEISNVFLTQKN